VFFILKSIFILLFMGGKMAYRGIKAHIEARRTARASPVEEEKK
jgi:hypothetical protein